jgi:hypothetical protein
VSAAQAFSATSCRRGSGRRPQRGAKIRAAHSRYFAGREADIMAYGAAPDSGEAHDWFTLEFANLRTAFR